MSAKKKNRKKVEQKPSNIKGETAVASRKRATLKLQLHTIYESGNLDTVCCRQCSCCRVACPQMKHSEAVNIMNTIFSKWSREDRKQFLITCVRYFFSDSLVKPCPMLDGADCRIYEDRPLNCRLYGLWPKDMWDERVNMFGKSTELPKSSLPLNFQCQSVKRVKISCPNCDGNGQTIAGGTAPDWILGTCENCSGTGKVDPGPLLKEDIDRLFRALDGMDAAIGVSEQKIQSGWNYRTIHDWALLKFWGEDTLVQWTNMLLQNSQEERDAVMNLFEELAGDIV